MCQFALWENVEPSAEYGTELVEHGRRLEPDGR